MRLKHFLSVFLTLLTLSVGQMWGATVTFTSSDDYESFSGSPSAYEKDGITVSGFGAVSNTDLRLYKGATLSISSSNTITQIDFTFTSGSYNGGWNGNSNTYSTGTISTNSWSKAATSGSSGKQARITQIVVTYEASNPATIYLNAEGGTCQYDSRTEESAGDGVTLPSASPSSSCASQNWIFAGWAKTAITETTTEPTLYTGSYTPVDGETLHAVYKKTESSGGSSDGSQTFTFSSIASANSWSNGVAYTPVVLSPVSLAGNGGGNNAKYYTSDKSWRMYSGGTVNISVEGGSVTSVSSTPSKTFTVSNGEASLSCTETIKFTEITVNYTVTGASVTTYNSNPSCCTPLGSINGSVFWRALKNPPWRV